MKWSQVAVLSAPDHGKGGEGSSIYQNLLEMHHLVCFQFLENTQDNMVAYARGRRQDRIR
jgi:hypothetical protein